MEAKLRRRMLKLGGQCYKWVSPGNNGVPDRIVLYSGSVYFVEMKFGNNPQSPNQLLKERELNKQGFPVYVLASEEQIDAFIRLITR